LLKIISKVYGKNIKIVEDSLMNIDRTLVTTKFKNETGYVESDWEVMVQNMFELNTIKYVR